MLSGTLRSLSSPFYRVLIRCAFVTLIIIVHYRELSSPEKESNSPQDSNHSHDTEDYTLDNTRGKTFLLETNVC